MEEKLAAFSYEVFDIIKNHKIIIEINSLRPLSDMKYEEIVQDILNFKKPHSTEFVSTALDEFFIESRAYDAEKIINEIGEFL